MVMWVVLVVCGVALVQGATRTDKNGVVHRRSIKTSPTYFNWNHVADNMLQLAKADMLQQGKTELPLPNVEESNTVTLGFIRVPYKLLASGGSVGNLTSFRRGGDVLLTDSSKESLQVGIPLTLNHLPVGYGLYQLALLGLDISGALTGTLDAISILISIHGNEEGLGYTASLVDVKVTELGRMNVEITGLGAINGIASTVVGWLLQQQKHLIMSSVESVLLEQLREFLGSM